jgi:hypothetical protein
LGSGATQLSSGALIPTIWVSDRCLSGGYTDLDSVLRVPAPKRDKMETFFLGETLK